MYGTWNLYTVWTDRHLLGKKLKWNLILGVQDQKISWKETLVIALT